MTILTESKISDIEENIQQGLFSYKVKSLEEHLAENAKPFPDEVKRHFVMSDEPGKIINLIRPQPNEIKLTVEWEDPTERLGYLLPANRQCNYYISLIDSKTTEPPLPFQIVYDTNQNSNQFNLF